jgi:hypothetical protein
MSVSTESVAKIAEQGGAAVAMGSWGISSVDWLNHNSAAVLAICGILGAVVSVVGGIATGYYRHKRYQQAMRFQPPRY